MSYRQFSISSPTFFTVLDFSFVVALFFFFQCFVFFFLFLSTFLIFLISFFGGVPSLRLVFIPPPFHFPFSLLSLSPSLQLSILPFCYVVISLFSLLSLSHVASFTLFPHLSRLHFFSPLHLVLQPPSPPSHILFLSSPLFTSLPVFSVFHFLYLFLLLTPLCLDFLPLSFFRLSSSFFPSFSSFPAFRPLFLLLPSSLQFSSILQHCRLFLPRRLQWNEAIGGTSFHFSPFPSKGFLGFFVVCSIFSVNVS